MKKLHKIEICPNWIIALLEDISAHLERAYWNIYQKEYYSPMRNSGEHLKGKTFELHAYDWSGESPYKYNFKSGDIEISWYKYLGRGTFINKNFNPEYVIKCYTKIIKEISKYSEKNNPFKG